MFKDASFNSPFALVCVHLHALFPFLTDLYVVATRGSSPADNITSAQLLPEVLWWWPQLERKIENFS